MKNNSGSKNKVLFGIMVAALSMDLGSRLTGYTGSSSIDLASSSGGESAAAEQCSAEIIKGLSNTGVGGCAISQDGNQTTAKVKYGKRASPDGWGDKEAPVPRVNIPDPGPKPEQVEANCSKLKANSAAKRTCEAKQKKEKTSFEAKVTEWNKKKDAYDNAVAAALAAQAQKERENETLDVELNTTAEGCDSCASQTTFQVLKSKTSPSQLAQLILEKTKARHAELAKAKAEAKKAEEKRLAQAKEEEKLKIDIENCRRSEDGKILPAMEQVSCQSEKLATDDTKEAQARYAKIQSALQQMITGGTDEERKQALLIADQIATQSGAPRSVRESAAVIRMAGRYQSQIMSLTEALARTPQGNPARSFYLMRLQSLQTQMQFEVGSKLNYYGQLSMMGRSSSASGIYDELSTWYGTLNNSMAIAVQTVSVNPQAIPGTLGQQPQGNGQQRLGVDLNINGRTVRAGGTQLMTQQNQFASLTGNSAVDAGLAYQNQMQNLTLPGLNQTPGTLVQSGRPMPMNQNRVQQPIAPPVANGTPGRVIR